MFLEWALDWNCRAAGEQVLFPGAQPAFAGRAPRDRGVDAGEPARHASAGLLRRAPGAYRPGAQVLRRLGPMMGQNAWILDDFGRF